MPSRRAKLTEEDVEAILVGLRYAQVQSERKPWPWMRFTKLGKHRIRVTRPDGLMSDWFDSKADEDDMEEALP